MKIRSRSGLLAALIVLPLMVGLYLFAAIAFLPQLLFFPHHRQIGGVSLYSEAPIPEAADEVVARAQALLAASPLFRPGETFRPVFVTNGGWRWKLLALGATGAFGVTRASSESVIVNRSDIAADRVWRGSAVAGERSLSGVIAHERVHTLTRRRFGFLADSVYPRWVREGYADYVAGSSSLSDPEAARLRNTESPPAALFYYDARRRVAAILALNGGSVEDLFEGSRARGNR
jgi:hypothetical protein